MGQLQAEAAKPSDEDVGLLGVAASTGQGLDVDGSRREHPARLLIAHLHHHLAHVLALGHEPEGALNVLLVEDCGVQRLDCPLLDASREMNQKKKKFTFTV